MCVSELFSLPGIFLAYALKLKANFDRIISLHGGFSGISQGFHGSFTLVSRGFHGRFTGVSRTFHMGFTGISWAFHGGFTRVSHTRGHESVCVKQQISLHV